MLFFKLYNQMNERIIQVKPSNKQFKALQILLNNNWVSFLWYWWAAWWWKTILAAIWISMMCKKYPWVKYWVFRRYITDVLDTTFQSFTKALIILWLKEASSIDILNKNPWLYDYVIRNWWKEITFSNWSEILFRWLQDKPTDVHFTKIWWLELTWAYIDEANECPELWVSVLRKRVWRHMNKEYWIARKVLATFNPDKWWVFRTFYLPYKNKQEAIDTKFIPALPTDNPYLTQEYLDELKNEKNEVLRQRLYYWNFDYDDTPWRLFEYNKILQLRDYKTPYNNNRYISCDAARKWKDKAVIFVWEWFNVIDYFIFDISKTTEISQKIRELQNQYWVDNQRTIVDEDWVGWWIVDELWCVWFINNSSAISPYWAKNNNYLKRNYANLKTQCYFELARVVNDNIMYINIPEQSKIEEELDIIVQIDLDKDSKIRIISKDDIKEKLWRSPDYSDTLMMRMYFVLIYEWIPQEQEQIKDIKSRVIYDDMYESLEDAINNYVEIDETADVSLL